VKGGILYTVHGAKNKDFRLKRHLNLRLPQTVKRMALFAILGMKK